MILKNLESLRCDNGFIKKSDLINANNDSLTMLRNLATDQEDAQEMINIIQDFISSSSSQLKGDAYDVVRAHMKTYIPILQNRIKVAASLIDVIKNANNSMISYMENESVLNTDELERLNNEYNNCINEAQRSLNSANAYVTQQAKNEAMAIYESYSAEAKKINKKIQLIEGLSAKTMLYIVNYVE